MRGSLTLPLVVLDEVGIIPAHAGLTTLPQFPSSVPRDHPRACGAHPNCAPPGPSTQGSSPRMRGSQEMLDEKPFAFGIIPAHAGLTAASPDRPGGCRDHPRACGAHTVSVLDKQAAGGSSPRMRGSH